MMAPMYSSAARYRKASWTSPAVPPVAEYIAIRSTPVSTRRAARYPWKRTAGGQLLTCRTALAATGAPFG